ncbi:MAG TPA: dihydrolipoamide acetyltransferase family protein [Candidatus Acidoferrales bacterium]|nr:dihydrolipoamide acetyltransferase family protein [Candidatus Acidoferrales bacterium]
MAVDVVMPQMGESIFEGTITKWLKKPGERVERDEPLFEISTDKVDAEIPAPSAGVLKEIKVNEGQTVPVQTVVGVIDAAGAAAGAPAGAKAEAQTPAKAAPAKSGKESGPAQAKLEASAQQPKPTPAAPQADGSGERTKPGAPDTAQTKQAAGKDVEAGEENSAHEAEDETDESESGDESPETAAGGDGHNVRSSPLVRRIARENKIDLSTLSGSGAGGRISKKDILAAVAAGGSRQASPAPRPSQAALAAPPARPAAAPPPATGGAAAHVGLETAVPRERIYFGNYEVQPMSVMRQRIAEHMVASKRVSPHVYSIDEADMTKIAGVRAKAKTEFESRFETKLSFMPFFLSAAVEALRAFPTVNSSVDGNNVVFHREINLGVAVALDNGLIVPVVKNAEEKNFLGLQRAVNDLAERARTKKLKPEDVQEGTFAITNPGTFGGLMGLPIINQPNVAILGVGAIQKRAVVIDDAIAIRSMVYLTLSYDHRVVDGATAHQFMGKVKETLEHWAEPII